MFQLLIHEESQRGILYQRNPNVPEGGIPNVMSLAKSLNVSSNVEDVWDGSSYVECTDYVPESNLLVTSVGEIAIDVYEKNQIYFNTTSSDVYVYGQKLPETHALVDLPEEYNDAPETVSYTRTDDGTYTFTENAVAVMGRQRHLLNPAIEERNRELTASDWTQVPDSPLSDEKKDAWRVYRQTLRDFPNTYTGAPEDWRTAFPTRP
jgi:hypothetical protein